MRLYRRNRKWWFDLRFRGKRYTTPTHSTDRKRAQQIMMAFIADLEVGLYRPHAEKVTFERLCKLARDHYRINNRRSPRALNAALNRLARTFAGVRAVDITSARIAEYTAHRLEENAAKSTINKELSALSLMFSLAVEHELLVRKPVIHRLDTSDNVRQGFVSQGDYYAIREHLPERLADLTDFLWWTGLRLGTARQLEWRDVYENPVGGRIRKDAQSGGSLGAWSLSRTETLGRQAVDQQDYVALGTLRIRSETTKTNQAHEIPLVGKIAVVIERASRYRTILSPYVFHVDGRQMSGTWAWTHWKRAAREAGLEHILIHDLRRSFVRNMRLAGIPDATVMTFTGHKTRAIYLRYNIVDLDEKTAALERLEASLKGQSKKPSVRRIK